MSDTLLQKITEIQNITMNNNNNNNNNNKTIISSNKRPSPSLFYNIYDVYNLWDKREKTQRGETYRRISSV